MRQVWSEVHRRRLWRRIWVALAEAEQAAGLVTAEQVADLRAHADEINLARALEIEAEIHHDLMAEVRAYAEQCPVGGPIIHLGATSMDIEDNAEVLRLREALDLLLEKLRKLLLAFAGQIEAWADAPTMAFTHLQPAEPTTIGYRLAQYAQDLWADWQELTRVRAELRGKGFKGAVGTSASYAQLLAGTSRLTFTSRFTHLASSKPASCPPSASTRSPWPPKPTRANRTIACSRRWPGWGDRSTSSRSICASCSRRPSASGPSRSERGRSGRARCRSSATRSTPRTWTAWRAIWPRCRASRGTTRRTACWSARWTTRPTAARSCRRHSWRPTSWSRAGRGSSPGCASIADASARLLAEYGPFAATERLLMELVKAGGDRQELHETIREHSMTAWAAIRRGEPNPLVDLLCNDSRITFHVSRYHVLTWLDASGYVGDAPERARAFADMLRRELQGSSAA